MKRLIMISFLAVGALADVEVIEKPHSISMESNGKALWTFNHDPAEGKPYFHPLASSDGTLFTGLRPDDHPWHRAVWFSWKFINGVNYWEEDRKKGKSAGETRIISIDRSVAADQSVKLGLKLDYAPTGSDDLVMREARNIVVSAPDTSGTYHIDWSSTFTAVKDITLDRTPLPGQEGGKSWGGYAGWSVRMNDAMKGGQFLNSEGGETAHHEAAAWTLFNAPKGGSLIFMDHPSNVSYPSKWYVAANMPYFSPAVIHDAPLSLKAGETLSLSYRLVVTPAALTAEDAAKAWRVWAPKKVVILTGANNHDWASTTTALEDVLEGSGKFAIEVVTDPEQLTAEFLKNKNVLLSNWNAFGKPKPAPWSDELKKAYVEFVRNGGGHVVVHAGSSSFYDWNDYHAICLATWKGETGHKKPHEFEVRISNSEHSIVQGLEPFKITDELWFKPFVHPDAEVIAEAFSQHTGQWEPAAFVNPFGEGRCFALLLGHNAKFMQQDGFKALLTSGTEWAAGIR